MHQVAGWPEAFRGSRAVAAGLTTRNRLQGPGFRRVFPDTYVRRADELTLTLRSLAAYRYAEPRGEHTTPERVLRDIRRGTRLVDQGRRLYRYTTLEIYAEPERIIAEVRRALTRAA